MKNILILLVLSVYCCKPDNEVSITLNPISDSINKHYIGSFDTNLPLIRRQKEINKALFYTKAIKKSNLYSQILYQKNNLHYSSKEYDSLFFYNNLLINHARRIKDYTILSYQYYLMGYYYSEITQIPDSAFLNYNLSKSYFLKIKDSSWIGRNLLNMGTIQKDQNDFFGSKETITESLQYFTKKDDSVLIAASFNILATDHRKLLNLLDAEDYYLRAIEVTTSPKYKLVYRNNLAATYIDNKTYSKAISTLEYILNDTLIVENKIEHARVLDNLSYAKWLSGVEIIEKDLQEPLRMRINNKDLRGQIASYTHLGEYNFKANPLEAKSYFDSVIQLSKRLKMPRAEKDVLKFLMSLEPNNVNIRDRYVYLQESLYQKELQVKTQFAKYKYDDKLQQESILRLEKENAEKKLEAIRQRNQKTLYLGGMFLSISILGFTYYSFKQRSKRLKNENKTAKLEATYETEAELSRKLHDDFGGKLNHAMLLLQNGEKNSEVLNIVGGLYNQSRDFSREINDIDTGPNYKNVLFGMMGNYCGKTKLIVTGSNDVEWKKVSSLYKKTLYKVLQELMINMQKHSNASMVSVAFYQSKKKLKVDYSDDGIGASTDALNLKNGLWNTEKRIQAIGGTIIFDSEEGNGFEAKIEVPN